MKNRKWIGLACLCGATGIFGLLGAAAIVPSYLPTTDHSTELEAPIFVRSLNVAQQIHKLRHSAFTADHTELWVGLPMETESYRYGIALAPSGQAVQHFAEAKTAQLNSYIGFVWEQDSEDGPETYTMMCSGLANAELPTEFAFPVDLATMNSPQCPEGFERYSGAS